MTQEQINEVVSLHQKWVNNEGGGVQANLGGANLEDANLEDANLEDASLVGANLRGANLRGANLRGANLEDADLVGANLRGANLEDANLVGANLRGASLRGANLRGANGNLRHVKSIQTEKYYITYTSTILQIGCQKHTINEWANFDDETISKMGSGALGWWAKWKPIIMQIIEMSPCEPTKA